MEMETFWKGISLAYTLVGIRQRGKLTLSSSRERPKFDSCAGNRQILIPVSSPVTATHSSAKDFAKPFSALISTTFTCCTNYTQKQKEHSSPLQKAFKAFFNDWKKKILINKKVIYFTLIPLNSSFLRTWTLKRTGSVGRWTGDRSFQAQLD